MRNRPLITVATVMIASSGPKPSSFAVLMEASTLHTEDRPKWRRVSSTWRGTPRRSAR